MQIMLMTTEEINIKIMFRQILDIGKYPSFFRMKEKGTLIGCGRTPSPSAGWSAKAVVCQLLIVSGTVTVNELFPLDLHDIQF